MIYSLGQGLEAIADTSCHLGSSGVPTKMVNFITFTSQYYTESADIEKHSNYWRYKLSFWEVGLYLWDCEFHDIYFIIL